MKLTGVFSLLALLLPIAMASPTAFLHSTRGKNGASVVGSSSSGYPLPRYYNRRNSGSGSGFAYSGGSGSGSGYSNGWSSESSNSGSYDSSSADAPTSSEDSSSTFSSDPESSSSPDSDDRNNDIRVLNFALTFGHLAEAFYDTALLRYDEEEFRSKGYPEWVRGRYEQIGEHEKAHVEFLESAIRGAGAATVERCEYIFPDSNSQEFVELSEAIETIGVSTYNGLLQHLEDKQYVTVLGSILGVEARHAAWINSAVKKQNGWNTAFEAPITMNQAWTIMHTFVASCPNENEENSTTAPLPTGLRVYPTLTLPARIKAGTNIELSFTEDSPRPGATLFAAFSIGTGTYLQPIYTTEDGKYCVTVPEELEVKGAVYIVVVQAGEEDVGLLVAEDESMVAGPALVMFGFDSEGKEEDENNGGW